jgi:hypothetical protein
MTFLPLKDALNLSPFTLMNVAVPPPFVIAWTIPVALQFLLEIQ